MLPTRRWLVLIFCGLCSMRVQAATVSFLIIETGLPMEAGTSAYSFQWESALLDVFFDAGHIVSNAPVLRLDQKPVEIFPNAACPDLADAVEGGAEFFILALLDYSTPVNEVIQKPRHISLRLFQTRPHRLVYERQYTDAGSGSPNSDFDNLKRSLRDIVPHLNGIY